VDLRQLAPACHDCETPIARVEYSCHLDEDGEWRIRAWLVCPAGHRLLVEPFGL
jgi:hypothetical protein